VSSSAAERFEPSADALATRVGDEIVLVHTRTDKIYVLNRTGARVWELLDGALERGQLAERLADEFDATPDQLAREVDALIDALLEGHLIVGRRHD
jgi:hypothetical protein